MRCVILHVTDARWEAGERPGPALIERVGKLLGELGQAGKLVGAEGLRASSLGARLTVSGGRREVAPGPFAGSNELAQGFCIIRAGTLDQAVGWASRWAEAVGGAEIDVRPVTEPWDIGLGQRPHPSPETRFMLLHKATPDSEAGTAAPAQGALEQLVGEMSRAGVLVTREALLPSREGKRLRMVAGRQAITDGPFAESKELIAGYVLVRVDSLSDAVGWTQRYAEAVESACVELRPVVG